MTLSRWFKRFRAAQDGNILIISAVVVPVLLTAAGVAIDLTRYLKSSDYVQSAVDQAAIAAASVDGQDRNEIARRFFQSSLSADLQEYITLNSIDVQEHFPTGGPLSVTVAAEVTMKNRFGGLLGIDTSTIARAGQATRRVHNVEAVVTMATSGTMCADKSRIPNQNEYIEGDTLVKLTPDVRCTDFEAMKQGAKDFIDIIGSNETVGDFKIGLVPYNFKVKMPDLQNIPPSLTAQESDGFYQNLSESEPLAAVLPLTSQLDRVRRHIDQMHQTPEGIAWGRSDLASHVAGLMLDPDDTQYFPGGETPTAFGSDKAQKVVVMMTDGANIGCCYTNWPTGNYENQYVYFYKPYNDQQLEICSLLKQQGVQIFSILFDVKETDAGGREINNVFSRCASGAYTDRTAEQDPNAMLKCSEKQYCFNVANSEDLIKAYRQIAQTFYKPTITK